MTETLLDPKADTAFDPNKDYWTEYTGPGGKFHDPDETVAKQKIARAKAEADLTIAQRNRALDEIRQEHLRLQEEYKAGQSLKEYIDQLKAQPLTSNAEPKVNEVNQPAIKPEDIESLVASQIDRRETINRETSNYNTVKAKLEETYGENYKGILAKQSNDLGMSAEEVDSLARRNPKVFMRTFGLDAAPKKDAFEAPPRSAQRSDPLVPGSNKPRTMAYYQKLKQSNPKLFLDPKINNQMISDIKAIGEEAFYDA
jgi:hypothetical protein